MSLASRMIDRALTQGLLQGKLSYAGQSYSCAHSPINTQMLLSAEGGGFTPLTLVTIILSASIGVSFEMNTPATLTANDGHDYAIRLDSNEANGNGMFIQITAHHISQGA